MTATSKTLIGLMGAFVVVSLLYAWATPIFEAPDELFHFGMVNYVASTGALPVQQVGKFPDWGQEGSQPPLYYLIAAALVAPIDRSDYDSLRQLNPHAIIGDPGANGNKNYVLHDAPYPPPLHSTALAVYIARLFSIALGTITVGAVYASARLLAPEKPSVALLAAGLTAFNPQFAFISASVNNDNLVTALNSLIIWQTLVMLRDGFNSRRSLLIAVLVALATISKLSGWVAAFVVVIAALWLLFRRRDWRGFLTLGVLLAVCWALLAGWWYARNITLYGELTGMQTMLNIFGRRPPPSLNQLLNAEFAGLRISYWGLFGWFNVFTFQPFYPVMDTLVVAAIIGLLAYCWRIRTNREQAARIVLLALMIAVTAISLISWTMQTAASQGRLLFPCVAATSSLLALGLSTLRVPARLIVIPLGVFALIVPFATIMPQYAPPAPVDNLPDKATPYYARFGDTELLGYETPVNRYGPGDDVPVTLYWKPLHMSDLDHSLYINLLDSEDKVIAKLPSYPGYGRMRTTTWLPGVIYPDFYRVRIPTKVTGSFELRANVGWWKYPEGYRLKPLDQGGQPLNYLIFPAGGFSSPNLTPSKMANPIEPVDFGGKIRLLGYEWHDADLTLLWQAADVMDDDYTVFVFALKRDYQVGGDNIILAQGDAPPSLPTHYWRRDEQFTTQHHLTFREQPAPGAYPVYVGWYSTRYPARLSADYPDNAYLLAAYTVH